MIGVGVVAFYRKQVNKIPKRANWWLISYGGFSEDRNAGWEF